MDPLNRESNTTSKAAEALEKLLKYKYVVIGIRWPRNCSWKEWWYNPTGWYEKYGRRATGIPKDIPQEFKNRIRNWMSKKGNFHCTLNLSYKLTREELEWLVTPPVMVPGSLQPAYSPAECFLFAMLNKDY